ncbi:RNA polymerase sigma-70 factor [Saccharicrinis sp. FJH54]|uniref:RNA polymerase sigma-70 factor n=1 Tax=Saccharicrinis sp. FJH54 TaxID=3344665 RepID=UPI0035D43128
MSSSETILLEKFEHLFREHFTALCFFAQKYLGDMDSSKDLVHEVFVKVWDKRNEFDFEKPAKSYLFTSVYNRCLNQIRDARKFNRTEDNELEQSLSHDGSDNESIEMAELKSLIQKSLNSLPEKCRAVFNLSRYEGKSYAEIAEVLKISNKTVEAHMSKALRVLREDLKEYLTILILIILKNNNLL